MTAITNTSEMSIDCRVHLPDFEGPMDLLLHLVKTHEMDILNLSISKITEQYLRYLDYMRQMNLDLASEYLVMAATLTYLKSQIIVPQDQRDEETGLDPRAKLIRRLIELKCYKELAADLKSRPRLYRDVFLCKNTGLEEIEVEKEPQVALTNPYQLLTSYQSLIERRKDVVHNIYEDAVPVTAQIRAIILRLKTSSRFSFRSLLPSLESVPHVISNFLAMLEMAKLQVITFRQTENFGPIDIERRASEEELEAFEKTTKQQLSWD
ncbi:segregation/condensation protein A [bacterium]|nr:segregation/condensation protein A [bacterium]